MKAIQCIMSSLLLIGVWSCNPKDPEPDLPDYLVVPSSLTNYSGSGRVTVSGGLSFAAEGPERKSGSFWTGVSTQGVFDGITIHLTLDQPLPNAERETVPVEYRSFSTLRIVNTKAVGTYPMGSMTPGPKGELADLFVFRPGQNVYITSEGSLTVEESTLIKVDKDNSLYRVSGSFDANLFGSGPSVIDQQPHVTGTFDVLVVTD